MKQLITALFLLFWFSGNAQVNPADTIPAVINANQENSTLHFNASLRDLRQIAGAPLPFYTYFWEFGDGNFSFEKEPSHSYRDTGTYDVRVYATNNYDDGKPPPTKPKKLSVPKATPVSYIGRAHV